MVLQDGYWIVLGYMSRSQMQIDGYEIKGLPVQEDQRSGRQWIRPGNDADVVRPASIVDSISGKRYAYGGSTFTWPMVNLSPKMVKYLHETYFDNDWSSELTIQTFNRATGNWEAYQAVARWPDYASEAETAAGGYNNFKIAFVNCSPAPQGPDVATGGDAFGSFTLGSTGTYAVAITNIGDTPTFAEISVTTVLDDNQVYAGSSGFSWVAYWSGNGVEYFPILSEPPNDVVDIRYLKWIYLENLETLQTSYDLNLTVLFNASGNFTNDFTVYNDGDIDTTNNTITFDVVIVSSPYTSGFDNESFGLSDRGFDFGFLVPAFGISSYGFTTGFSNGFGATPEP